MVVDPLMIFTDYLLYYIYYICYKYIYVIMVHTYTRSYDSYESKASLNNLAALSQHRCSWNTIEFESLQLLMYREVKLKSIYDSLLLFESMYQTHEHIFQPKKEEKSYSWISQGLCPRNQDCQISEAPPPAQTPGPHRLLWVKVLASLAPWTGWWTWSTSEWSGYYSLLKYRPSFWCHYWLVGVLPFPDAS